MTSLIMPRALPDADVSAISTALFEGTSLTDLRSIYIDKGSDLSRFGAKPLEDGRRYTTAWELGSTLLDALGKDLVVDERLGSGIWTWSSLYAADDLAPPDMTIEPRKEANWNKFVPDRSDSGTRKGRTFTRSMTRIMLEARNSGRSRSKLLCMHPAKFNNRVIQHITGGTGRFSMMRYPLLLDLIEDLYVRDEDHKREYRGHSSAETHIDLLVSFLQEIDQTYCIGKLSHTQLVDLLPEAFRALLPAEFDHPGFSPAEDPIGMTDAFYSRLSELMLEPSLLAETGADL